MIILGIEQWTRMLLLSLFLGIWMPSLMAAAPEYRVRVLIESSPAMASADTQNTRAALVQALIAAQPREWDLQIFGFHQNLYPLYTEGQMEEKPAPFDDKTSAAELGKALYALNAYEEDNSLKNRPTESLWIILTHTGVQVSSDPLVNHAAAGYIDKVFAPSLKKKALSFIAMGLQTDEHSLAVLSDLVHRPREKPLLEVDNSLDSKGIEQIIHSIEKWYQNMRLKYQEHSLVMADNTQPLMMIYNNYVRLIQPDGKISSAFKKQDNEQWWIDDGITWVSIKNPKTGTWKIEGALPEKVPYKIYSDLKIRLSPLDTDYMVGEELSLCADILDGETLILDQDFLEKLHVFVGRGTIDKGIVSDLEQYPGTPLELAPELKYTGKLVLKDRSKAKSDGLWIRVVGPTFVLEDNMPFTVHPHALKWQQSIEKMTMESSAYLFSLIPVVDFLDPAHTIIDMTINNTQIIRPIYQEDGYWNLSMVMENRSVPMKIDTNMRSMTKKGRFLQVNLPSFSLIPLSKEQIPVREKVVIEYRDPIVPDTTPERLVAQRYALLFFCLMCFTLSACLGFIVFMKETIRQHILTLRELVHSWKLSV